MSEVTNYGVQETVEVFEAADHLVDLYKDLRGEGEGNNKLTFKNWPILLSKAPPTVNAVMKAADGIENIPKELTDLDEHEKQELVSLFGDKVHDPRYQKVFIGIVQIADGLTELVKGEEN